MSYPMLKVSVKRVDPADHTNLADVVLPVAQCNELDKGTARCPECLRPVTLHLDTIPPIPPHGEHILQLGGCSLEGKTTKASRRRQNKKKLKLLAEN